MAAHTGRARERFSYLPGAAAAAIFVSAVAHAPRRSPETLAAPHACALQPGAGAAAHTGWLAPSPRGRRWSRGHRTHLPGPDQR